MADLELSLGKGLQEKLSPNRTVMVYGAELGVLEAAVLYPPLQVVEASTSFDLAYILPNREVAVALATVRAASPGNYTVTFKWYRQRDSALIRQTAVPLYTSVPAWLSAYDVIGWLPWEITENGHHVLGVEVTGPMVATGAIVFTITGITEAPVPPAPSGGDLSGVIAAFEQASAFLYSCYRVAYDWIWPFWLIAVPLYQLSALFMTMAEGLANFNTWVSDVTKLITSVLSWDSIRAMILGWLPGLLGLLSWFSTWSDQLLAIVNNWWSGVQATVWGWIDAATQGLGELIAAWGEFRDSTLPNLVSWSWLQDWWNSRVLEVQGLIDSGFKLREGLWAGWQDYRVKVGEFFADPGAWLLREIENMLARFW